MWAHFILIEVEVQLDRNERREERGPSWFMDWAHKTL